MPNYFKVQLFVCASLLAVCGCSSAGGFTLWPNQFPLLPQAKQFALQAPLPSTLPIEECKTVLPAYYVEPGDDLFIEPVDFSADLRLPADQRVMVDGTIDLGEFGRLVVAGKTIEEIEAAIEARITEVSEQHHRVNVRLLEANASQVYVLGEVGSPAAYPLVGRETVLDAILLAGGLTNRASPCDIILVRPTGPCECRVVLPVCYRQITQLGDTTTNYQLQPGDRIYVGGRTLCQELRFWSVNQPCERCCESRCMERDARQADYRNPFCYLPISPLFQRQNQPSPAEGSEPVQPAPAPAVTSEVRFADPQVSTRSLPHIQAASTQANLQ